MIFKSLALLLSIKLSLFACASGWNFHDTQFIFLEERNIPFSNYSGNLKDSATYNNINRNYQRKNKTQNLLEWQEQLKEKLSLEQIEQIVYKRQNLHLVKDKEILEYLDFVQKQESLVISDYYYFKKDKIKKDEKLLISEALTNLQKIKSNYLKLRYFYLAFRLAHFKKQNPLEIYNKYKYLLNNNNKTIVKDWINALYAGALIKDGQTALGVYKFTRLLNKDVINWHLSFYNFHHIKTNKLWNELISYAKDDEEKAKFYALRALNENSNIIEELKNINNINKNSKWFDFILYRQLLYTQHFFDEHKLYERDFQINKFIKYLSSVKKENMYTINLSLAYLYLYKNDLEKATQISNKLKENHETNTFKYILYLNKLNKIDLEIENKIYENMTKLIAEHEHPNNDIHDYTFVKLKHLYKKQNDNFKSLLSTNINYLDSNAFDLKTIEKFKSFIQNKRDSKLEDYFVNKYLQNNHIQKKQNSVTFSNNLKKAYTKILINNLKFEEALAVNSTYLNEKIKFNPFNVNIRGNNRKGKEFTYTLKEFLEKVIIIQKELKKNPSSVMDNYLYANAVYNLSYFGSSNILTTMYRSVYSFPHKDLETKKVNTSIKHYKKALEKAKKKEFKAKITYMLAKSELALFDIKYSKKSTPYYSQKESYESDRFWFYSTEDIYRKYIKNGYGKFFDDLQDKYSSTNYYKELIKECANLRFYQREKI